MNIKKLHDKLVKIEEKLWREAELKHTTESDPMREVSKLLTSAYMLLEDSMGKE